MLRNMQGFSNNQHGLIYMYFKHHITYHSAVVEVIKLREFKSYFISYYWGHLPTSASATSINQICSEGWYFSYNTFIYFIKWYRSIRQRIMQRTTISVNPSRGLCCWASVASLAGETRSNINERTYRKLCKQRNSEMMGCDTPISWHATLLHCHFSSNLFHRQITQIAIHHLSGP